MRRRFFWLMVFVLVLFLLALPVSSPLAGEAEKKAQATAGLVGTIVAVIPESRTLVVDVPLSADVLRIGAEITKRTKIEAAGAAASFESLKPGARVRLNFRRVATGNEAISVEILRGAEG
jgi:hypothetical protein